MDSIVLSKDNSKRNVFIILIALLLFAYVFMRAYLMSITRDESYTFLEFVKPGYWVPHVYNDVSANDHLLNTWLMIITHTLFGSSELSLRLPNVLAFILFLYFCFKFTKEITDPVLAVSAFILLTVNPYLLDFFSVARGYGISMALTMGSLYYFYRWLNDRVQFRFAFISLLFSAFAVLANFTLINAFLLISASEFILILFSSEANKIRKFAALALIPAALFIIIVPVLIGLKNAGSFNIQHFGPPKGIWGDTFQTLIYKMFYQKITFPYAEEFFVFLAIILFIGGTLIVFRNKTNSSAVFFIKFLLSALVFLIALIYALHYLTGAQFPMDRTGLFFIPFISLLLVFIFRYWITKTKMAIYLAVAMSLTTIIHFGRSFNLLYAIEYKDDAYIKTAAAYIKEDGKNKKLSIGVHYAFYSTFNYYAHLWGQTNWLPTEHDAIWEQEHDYYFVYPRDHAELKMDSVHVVEKYELTNTLLLKNDRKERTCPIIFTKTELDEKITDPKRLSKEDAGNDQVSFITDTTWKFSPAITIILSDTIAKVDNIVLNFRAKVFSGFHDANAHLVMSVQRGDSIYHWQDYDMYFLIPENKWTDFSFNSILPKSAKPGDILKGYIWNVGIREVDVDEMVLSGRSYPF